LTASERQLATFDDHVSCPSPEELFAALNKTGTPDWSSMFRPAGGMLAGTRPQMALYLGGLIADGFVSIEARNASQVQNIAQEILAIAKPLGVHHEIMNRGKSLEEFAEKGQWGSLSDELDAMQNEVTLAMNAHKDVDLITLVLLGGWVRATEVAARHLALQYTPETAQLLKHPALVHRFRSRLAGLSPRVRDDSVVKKADRALLKAASCMEKPDATSLLPATAVIELRGIFEGLTADILKKQR
jgi:hypothetical protein